ncbi:MAG: CHAD domain-containing protein [Phycisphaerales bacterium]|nr:MAG: CHAD domain-containing protein [Phycisphaerales bacterium]
MTTVDQSYRLLACGYLRTQLDALMDAMGGIRDGEDIEHVHQSRVATRRIRAALGMFADCFPPKTVKRWRKQIRRLTRGLGLARDKDVQIEFVERFLSGLDDSHKDCRPGIARLELRLRQQRKNVQPDVVSTLDKFESAEIPMEMHCELERHLFGLRRTKATLQSSFVFQRTCEYILSRYDALCSNQASLDDPKDKRGHHQMRIAAKKLRYVLEICNPAYEERLSASVKTAKKLQSMLGEIHDCDVWMDFILRFAREEEQKTMDYFGDSGPFEVIEPGLTYLGQERQRCRDKTFEQLAAYRDKVKTNRVWEDMLSLVKACAE